VTVTDCHVTEFFTGIQIADSVDVTIRGNRANGNNQGIEVARASAMIIDNVASENRTWGFFLGEDGGDTQLVRNSSDDNGLIGYALNSASSYWLEDNSASGNQTNYDLLGSSENTLMGNLSQDADFHLGGSDRNTLIANVATGGGFALNDSSDNTLESNRASGTGIGFHSYLGSGNNQFVSNVSADNVEGIADQVSGDRTAGTASQYMGNVCDQNETDSNPVGLCGVPD
jgi:parallel beta-helix repeat protein